MAIGVEGRAAHVRKRHSRSGYLCAHYHSRGTHSEVNYLRFKCCTSGLRLSILFMGGANWNRGSLFLQDLLLVFFRLIRLQVYLMRIDQVVEN